MQGSATELHWEERLGVLLVSSSKEATKAVNLGGLKVGAVGQPLAAYRSRSKQTSSALQLGLGRTKFLNGESFEHLKAGGDLVKNLKGDHVKNKQYDGEDGLDWWEVAHSHIKYIMNIKYIQHTMCIKNIKFIIYIKSYISNR